MNRTPRSASRRASRQLSANVPGLARIRRRTGRRRFAAPSKDPSVPAPRTACGTPSRTARCASRFPDRRTPAEFSSLSRLQRIQVCAPILRRKALRIRQIQHRIANRAELHALESASAESRCPTAGRREAARCRPGPARSSRRTPADSPSRCRSRTTPTSPCSAGRRSASRSERT